MEPSSARAASARLIYGILGWCAVVLAAAGIVLPGLPTTVFVILASYCFARSSPRFERWLLGNRWFGPRLRRFLSDGGMRQSSKRAALAAMWTAVLVSAGLLAGVNVTAAIVVIALGVAGTFAILFVVPEAA